MTRKTLSFLKKNSGIIALLSLLLTITTILSYKKIKPRIVQRSLNAITQEFHAKHHAISNYFEQITATVIKIASHQESHSLLTKNNSPTQQDAYARLVSDYLPHQQFQDAFLLKPDGTIIFALNKKNLAGKKVTVKPYKQIALGKTFKRTFMTMSADISPITQTVSKGKQSILVATPIEQESIFIGVFIAELNPQKLFSIIDTNSYLYSAAETYLASSRNKRVRIIPLNNQQKTIVKKTTPYFHQLLNACNGRFSQEEATNQRQEKMLTVSGYIPEIHSGLVVALPYFYATALLTFLFWFIVALGLCTLLIGIMWHHSKGISIKQRIAQFSSPRSYLMHVYHSLAPHMPYALFGLALCGSLVMLGRYYKIRQHQITKAHAETNTTMRYITQQVNSALFETQSGAQTLAKSISSQNLSEAEIAQQVRSLLSHHKTLWSISVAFQPNQFNEQKRLHAPHWVHTKKGIELFHIDDSYDYTVPESNSSASTSWYHQALKQGAHWQDPYFDPVSHKKVLSFSLPFFHPSDTMQRKPRGVINVTYRLKSLRILIEQLGSRTAAHSIIINPAGHLIYHQDMRLVLDHKTIFDITKGDIKKASKAVHHYLAKQTENFSWVHDEHIPVTNWTFASAFTNSNIMVPTHLVLNVVIFLIIFLALVFFFILYFIVRRYISNEKKMRYTMIVYTLSLACGNIALWTFIYQQPWSPAENEVVIKDNARLYRFLDSLSQKALSEHKEKPVPVKTGIVINQIGETTPGETLFNANVWQTYNYHIHQNIKPGFIVPKAKKIKIREIFRKERGHKVTIGWNIRGILHQETDYSLYPFNKKHIIISLEHVDDQNNLVCVPDFGEYQKNGDSLHPWLDHRAAIIGKIEDSFFSYKRKPESLGIINVNRKLKLHLVSRVRIMNPLIAYLVPIVVILFAIFSLLWLEATSRISGLTGIFFATIVLHRSLRTGLGISKIIYLEYLFFLTYIMLLLLIVYSIISATQKLFGKEVHTNIKRYFWPLQLTLWLIITAAIFYQ